jgi:hypothetical protein
VDSGPPERRVVGQFQCGPVSPRPANAGFGETRPHKLTHNQAPVGAGLRRNKKCQEPFLGYLLMWRMVSVRRVTAVRLVYVGSAKNGC